MKGTQVCSNEGPCSFPRRDNYEIAKIHWQNLIIFFSRTTRPISTKLDTKHPLVKGTQVCSTSNERALSGLDWVNFNQTWHKASLGEGDSNSFKWRVRPFPRGDNYKTAKIHNMCLLIWTVFSGERCDPWASFWNDFIWIAERFDMVDRRILVEKFKLSYELRKNPQGFSFD